LLPENTMITFWRGVRKVNSHTCNGTVTSHVDDCASRAMTEASMPGFHVSVVPARLEAVSQAGPGRNRPGQAGPEWRLREGFGPAWGPGKPKPGRQAAAFVLGIHPLRRRRRRPRRCPLRRLPLPTMPPPMTPSNRHPDDAPSNRHPRRCTLQPPPPTTTRRRPLQPPPRTTSSYDAPSDACDDSITMAPSDDPHDDSPL
jgi:hypothetical protein